MRGRNELRIYIRSTQGQRDESCITIENKGHPNGGSFTMAPGRQETNVSNGEQARAHECKRATKRVKHATFARAVLILSSRAALLF